METLLIVLVGLVAIALGVGFAVVLGRLKQIESARQNDQSAQLLNQNLQGLQQRIDAL